jgi:transposase InsO family protein
MARQGKFERRALLHKRIAVLAKRAARLFSEFKAVEQARVAAVRELERLERVSASEDSTGP